MSVLHVGAPRDVAAPAHHTPLSVAMSTPMRGVVLVRVIGEVDLVTADQCRRVLCHARREATDRSAGHLTGDDREVGGLVVCDLTAVSFLGAVGLGVLVEADALTARDGAALRLVVATRPVRRALALTGLDRRLSTRSRLRDALPARRDQPVSLA